MILTWKDATGKRRSKSISTGLTVKGNKKRAEKMLMKARSEFNPDNLAANKGMLFTDFLGKWLNDKVTDIPAEEYSNFAYYVKSNITPYFSAHNANRTLTWFREYGDWTPVPPRSRTRYICSPVF